MKKIGEKILGILICSIIILQSNVALAVSETDLKNEQNENNKKINEATSNLENVQVKKSETVKQVEELSTQIGNYESQIDQLNEQITNLNTKIDNAQKELENAQENYTKQKEALEARLVATYEGGETSFLDFLLSSENIIDFISNYYYISEIANNDAELLDRIEKQKQQIEASKKELEQNKQELSNTKANKQSISSQLQVAKKEKDGQVAKLSEEEKNLQQQIDELNEVNKSIDNKIAQARAEAERKRKEEEARKRAENANKTSGNSNGGTTSSSGSSGATSSPSSSGFIYPVPSAYAKITTGLYYSSGQYHGAVDFGIGGINGQPVYAVADGDVIISERLQGSYGNYIVIEHDNGIFTLYAHGQDGSRTVSVGDRVKQGQQIMRVGTTGNSTGPHLHFEVRRSPGTYSNRTNPEPFLP